MGAHQSDQPCGSLGTSQYLGSFPNEQKGVDKFESVLGSSEEHQRYSVVCFLLSEVGCHEKWFIKNNSLRSKSRNFILWNDKIKCYTSYNLYNIIKYITILNAGVVLLFW